MAITEDMEFPRLTPLGDRMPSGRCLFRRPEELTGDQFDLLAAAWAEKALEGDALTEFESAVASAPGKGERAESFRRVRLTPGNESWPGMHRALRKSPAGTAVRRTILPALLAVAAMLVIILYGPAGAKLRTPDNPDSTTGTASMSVAEIQGSLPIVRKETRAAIHHGTINREVHGKIGLPVDRAATASLVITSYNSTDDDNRNGAAGHTEPLALTHNSAAVLAIAPVMDMSLSTLVLPEVGQASSLPAERNWMLRSISFLASAVTGKEKEIDGYMIASGCVNGINTILGWDMELQQVSNRAGDPVAVSFSSALLSFTRPLNKTTP